MTMYHHTKFGYKQFIGSEDTVQMNSQLWIPSLWTQPSGTFTSNTAIWNLHFEHSNLEPSLWTQQSGTFTLNTAIWNLHFEHSNLEPSLWTQPSGTFTLNTAIWNLHFEHSHLETFTLNTAIWNLHFEHSHLEPSLRTQQSGTFTLNTAIWNLHFEHSHLEPSLWTQKSGTFALNTAIQSLQVALACDDVPNNINLVAKKKKRSAVSSADFVWTKIPNTHMHPTGVAHTHPYTRNIRQNNWQKPEQSIVSAHSVSHILSNYYFKQVTSC